ncbi:hypothetical protein [Botrimarina hoheduenensis]|uniref:FecR protein n=1 Tax=Botrimarina hoheduenensis TaxID=2528000 RepID=A0A5C5VY18_9BACT|nr:hypothetical protein [Botrimarina hoheduenensis]TWT42895.1 FecR protein [Botrimarina hoheduenensis]
MTKPVPTDSGDSLKRGAEEPATALPTSGPASGELAARARLRQLLSIAIDQGLEDQAGDEISTLLEKHPALIADYAAYLATESLIESSCGLTILDDSGETIATADTRHSLAIATTSSPNSSRVSTRRHPLGISLWGRLAQESMAHAGWLVAASLLIAFGGALAWWTTPPIATLVAARDAQFLGNANPTPGQTLGEDWIDLESGSIRLAMRGGVMASIDGPARFRPNGNNSADLDYGAVSVHIPPAGHGFELIGKNARIIDLGTGFRVVSAANGVMSVHVTEGFVNLVAAASKPVQLHAGELMGVDADGVASDRVLRPKTAGRFRFIDEHPESLGIDHFARDNSAAVFLEAHEVRLPYDLRLDLSSVGAHSTHSGEGSVAAEGTIVHSYLIHSAPTSERHEVRGSVRFPGKIIGVLCESDRLNATNDVLGAKWTLGCQHPERGSESHPDPNFDRITISPDRHEISAFFRTMSIDQLRVLVTAD